ncbi:DNA repair protein RadA [Candidatus Cerribacteria bacterium 'Amazon FNV 2010 28 9']|uniref:DNA repair protein RadA n=1 Tax=Candidatus Cerribacteria bacterium 'Amazon FNV 2010 28 9' TaxID=2081795 RepID=A0A317JPG1_9BACT|nr:MAG: DNA repair protein RadA [Candidatus Cerribacteria bacterium 'Amazon FNV 2010 28 9']
MAKPTTVYVCQNCGYSSPKWLGQCPECGQWNSMEEEISQGTGYRGQGVGKKQITGQTVRLSEVKAYDKAIVRVGTGMEEFDRVLGGGIVPGEVVLIGGEPGIGKSTLLTQLVLNLSSTSSAILYVAGEESPEQITMRIGRMSSRVQGTEDSEQWREHIVFCTSTDVDEVIATAQQEKPTLLIIDSIQTMTTGDLTGTAGSIGQLKECTERLTRIAKSMHIPTFLVGHVTKEGTIAGPKVLEHVVDAVLELSGERTGQFRLLRAIKNRFGATDEVGVFHLTDGGIEEVKNPSALFLEERVDGTAGSCLACVIEGTRPILIEIQALVVESQLAIPRRVARGVALPRIQLIAAVLQKHCGIPLGTADIFVNVAGGFTITEPAVDLAIALAIASSQKNVPISAASVCIGEVGLLGEVRKVSLLDKRVNEAKRLGYTTVISAQTSSALRTILQSMFGKKSSH